MSIFNNISLRKRILGSQLILVFILLASFAAYLYTKQLDLYTYLRAETHKIDKNWTQVTTDSLGAGNFEPEFYMAFKQSSAQFISRHIDNKIISFKKSEQQIFYKTEDIGFLEFFNTSFLMACLFALAVLLLIAFILNASLVLALKPIGYLRKIVEDVQAGKYDITTTYKGNDDVSRIIEVIQNVSTKLNQVASQASQLSDLATTDGMTGLYNHRHFKNELKSFLENMPKEKINLGLILLDVDHFKKFNDTYGHQQGDEVLKVFAKTLKNNARKQDLVARYGGEEFVALIHNPDKALLTSIGEKLRSAVEATKIKKLDEPGKTLSVTASFGAHLVLHANVDALKMTEYIEVCDKNLYLAKDKGRNCVVVS